MHTYYGQTLYTLLFLHSLFWFPFCKLLGFQQYNVAPIA